MLYILFLIMKPRIYSTLAFLVLLATVLGQKDPVTITYYVEHEVEQENDFIEITLAIRAESRALTDALANAKKTAQTVAAIGESYCMQTVKDTKKCKDAVEVSEFQIEPQYKMVRKQASFQNFVVTHEVVIKVLDTDQIGYLADKLLNVPDVSMEGFEWQPLKEVDPQAAAIKEGIEAGDGLCQQLDLTFGRILHVQEIIEEEEEPEGEEQQEEDGQEEPEIVTYKFQIECVPIVKKAKAK